MPFGGMAHPLVPGPAEFEQLDRGSRALISPPSNRTMAMGRAHVYQVNHCETEAEKVNCVALRRGLSRRCAMLNGEKGSSVFSFPLAQRHDPSRLDSRPTGNPRTR